MFYSTSSYFNRRTSTTRRISFYFINLDYLLFGGGGGGGVAQVFTAVFTTECVLKLGVGGLDFFRNGWNVFDFVIVLASLVDLGLEIVNGLSVLRGMRLV